MMDMSHTREPLPLDSELRRKALMNLGIFGDPLGSHEDVGRNFSAVLSLDGGGFHILWTLQLLKELERVASRGLGSHIRLVDIFDVITGTSAGALTATLILKGWPAERIEAFWLNQDGVERLYPYRNPVLGTALDLMRRFGFQFAREVLFRTAWYVDAPVYDKREIRRLTMECFGDETMGELCESAGRGLFLLNKDTESGYILPLGCIINYAPEPDERKVYGYLNSAELKVSAVLEAATSPPLLTRPLGPYLDAGYGSFNNPILMTFATVNDIIQKIGDDPSSSMSPVAVDRVTTKLTGKYLSGFRELDSDQPRTAAFSFGTAFTSSIPLPRWLSRNPFSPGYTWINWYVSDVQKESANLQNAFLSSRRILPSVDFRRFNMSFSEEVLKLLKDLSFGSIPGIRATRLHELTDEEIYYATALLEPAYMPIYQTIGQAVIEYMHENAGPDRNVFQSLNDELIDYRPNLEVPDPDERERRRYELEEKLRLTLGSESWIHRQPTGRPLTSYFSIPLPTLKAPFFQAQSPLDCE